MVLANETVADLSQANRGFQFVWQVAPNDVHDALLKSMDFFVVESGQAIESLILLATVTSIAYMLALIGVYHWFFQPFLWRIQIESTRAAIMLSFLPTSIILSRMKLISRRMRRAGSK